MDFHGHSPRIEISVLPYCFYVFGPALTNPCLVYISYSNLRCMYLKSSSITVMVADVHETYVTESKNRCQIKAYA